MNLKIVVRIRDNMSYSLLSVEHLSQFHNQALGCLNQIRTASLFPIVHLPDASL